MSSESDASSPPPPPPQPQQAPPPAPIFESDTAPPQSTEPEEQHTEEEETIPSTGVPLHSRIIAGLIDGVVAIGLIVTADAIIPFEQLDFLTQLMGVAYIVTRDSLPLFNGQSIGKSVMKYKAVTLDDRTLSGDWKTGALRNGALAFPFFAAIELAVLITREDKKDQGTRLGDEWAKTKVVSTQPAAQETS